MLISNGIWSQQIYDAWISSDVDEYPGKSINYAPDRILFIAYEKKGNLSKSEFDYKNNLFKLNYSLETLATFSISTLGEYSIKVMDLLYTEPGKIMLYGQARHTTTNDYQLCFIHLDHDLNLINYEILGEPDIHEVMMHFTFNQSGKMVFVGSNSPEAAQGNYLIWEFSTAGYETGKFELESIHAIKPMIIELPEAQCYHICDSYGALKVNQDFIITDTLHWVDTINVSPDQPLKRISGTEYIRQGTYLIPPIPGQPWEIDYAMNRLDPYGHIIQTDFFGEENIVDIPADLDFIVSDTIYFAGTTNLVSNPPEDSWITIYKTNTTGEVLDIINAGGNGYYITKDIVCLSTGGFLVSATYWDYENYPIPNDQRDIYLYSINYGDTAVFVDDNIQEEKLTISPNPFGESIYVSYYNKSFYLYFYDAQGKLHDVHQSNGNCEIFTGNWQAGIYFYRIIRENQIISTGKIIKVNNK